MIDVKRIQEDKLAIKTVWEMFVSTTEFPDRKMNLWLLEYGREEIETAITELAKREEDVKDATAYVEKILRNAKLRGMSVEERQKKISDLRSLAGTIGAMKKHQAEEIAIRRSFAMRLKEVATTLPEFALGTGVGSDGVGGPDSVSDAGYDTVSVANPAAAPPPVASTASQTSGEKPKPQNLAGASSLSATEKPEPASHSRRNCKNCGEPLYRSENHTCSPKCTCGLEAEDERLGLPHDRGCGMYIPHDFGIDDL